jgi:hypothetical protein
MATVKIVERQHRGARDISSREAVDAIWSDAEKTVRGDMSVMRRRWIESQQEPQTDDD